MASSGVATLPTHQPVIISTYTQDGEVTVSDRGALHREAAPLLVLEPIGLRHGLDSGTTPRPQPAPGINTKSAQYWVPQIWTF